MTKTQILELAKKDHEGQEEHYLNAGPSKHQQDDLCGVQMVQENVSLLIGYLDLFSGDELSISAAYEDLPKADRREIWEASAFHFGCMGYQQRDADFFWESA